MEASSAERVSYRFPGPEFRPFPSFDFSCPVDWRPAEHPACVAAVKAPDDAGFTANVVITVDRLSSQLDLAAVAKMTFDAAIAAHVDLALEAEHVIVVSGQPALSRVQSFTDQATGTRLIQLQCLLFAPGGGEDTHDLLQLTGSSSAAAAEESLPLFRETIGSFRFSTAP